LATLGGGLIAAAESSGSRVNFPPRLSPFLVAQSPGGRDRPDRERAVTCPATANRQLRPGTTP